MAGYDPRVAIAVALSAAFVLVAFADLAIGLAIFAFLGFVEVVPVVSRAQPHQATRAIADSLVVRGPDDRAGSSARFRRVHPIVSTALGLFLGGSR